MRSPGGTILAVGELEIVRRVSGKTISGVTKEGVLPHVHPRALAAAGPKRIKGGGLDEGTGVGESGKEGWTGLRLCNLAAQSSGDAERGI